MLKLRLAETKDFSPAVLRELAAHFEVETGECRQEEIRGILENFDVFWFRLGFRITAETLPDNPRCRVIATPVTGIDHIDEDTCRERGIQIICLRGETDFLREVRATAELTIGLTLALLRKIVPATQDTLTGNWRRDMFRGNEIYQKTVGIVGVGRLGSIAASYFQAMGARVIGYDIRDDFPANVERFESLEKLIDAAEIVSLHVRYDASTHDLLNEAMFRHFNHDKILVNTSRGGVINEMALLTALDEKRLGGAALDVLREEAEMNYNHPLLEYARRNDNLLIVPHIGGNTFESFEKTEGFIAGKIKEAFPVGKINIKA